MSQFDNSITQRGTIIDISYADPIYCKMQGFTLDNGDKKIVEYTMTANKYRQENSKKNCSATFNTSAINEIIIIKDSKLNKTKISSGVTINFYTKNIGEDEITIKRTWQGFNDSPKSAFVTYKIKVVKHEL